LACDPRVASNDRGRPHGFLAMTDETTQIVRDAIGGDPMSVGKLVERFSALLEVQARYRLGPTPSAEATPEDVVHEAWLVTLPKLGNFVPRDGRYTPVLLSYLGKTICGLATNHLRGFLRRAGRERPLHGAGPSSDGVSEQLSAQIRSVVSMAAASELHHRIAADLDALDQEAREAVVLRGIEGLTNEEAAAELGEKPNTVAQRYRRALQRLRERLPRSIFDELVQA
jgi:RNA polymerase sigma factor (sigma-70 family)